MTTRPPIVWIPNKTIHHNDYPSSEFGDARFLTVGHVNRYDVQELYNHCQELLAEAQEQDYLVVGSLPIISLIPAVILLRKFGSLNMLLYKFGHYMPFRLEKEENGQLC